MSLSCAKKKCIQCVTPTCHVRIVIWNACTFVGTVFLELLGAQGHMCAGVWDVMATSASLGVKYIYKERLTILLDTN